MLLKSIKLENFRQFVKAEVDFSVDKNKNVTIIRGENGSGKTAFAQAFTWCLYGDTSFSDKSMLNKDVISKMNPSKDETVCVQLALIHGGTEYTITRKQIYKLSLNGVVKGNYTELIISFKKNGQQEFVKSIECDLRIKQILPKELSRYFFFDGERIEIMCKEVQRGRSQTFADAVQGLLGLNAFRDAIRDLKPTTTTSTMGLFNKDYDDHSGSKISAYTKEIVEFQNRLNTIDERLEEIENERLLASERCVELKEKIKEFADGEILQKQKDVLIRKIETIRNSKRETLENCLRLFNLQASSYFSRVLMKNAICLLNDADYTSKDIPQMHADTITFILNHKQCICGTKVEIGNDAYKELVKLFSYLPPESIGLSVGGFVNDTEDRVKIGADLFDAVSREFSILRTCDKDIIEYEKDIHLFETTLSAMEDVGHYQNELNTCETSLRNGKSEADNLLIEKGKIATLQQRQESERSGLTLRDANNRKIEIYKAYTQYMYDEIVEEYSKKESSTRKKLEDSINQIFKAIYNGGLSLSIDDKYNIQISVDNYSGENAQAETSTSQSISVIFAFITGIIKLARESSAETDLVASEPYPLVMDAPLSAFDRRRIKTVCETLPSIAEQVIIFIKDTDGELAEEYLDQKIGCRYDFEKQGEFLTSI